MKLLVFAHTPPPHHGQSFMVEKMIEGFGGDHRKRGNARPTEHGIECYHVNARVSKHLEDIGEFRPAKFLLMLWFCLQAIWCRFRHGVRILYYVPAPGKPSALYRDWLVMALCRPFYKRVILHWHASGLAKWLETVRQVRSRSITFRLMGRADLSVVLSKYGRSDAEKLYPKRLAVVGNGISDPCPSFREKILPGRRARFEARRQLLAGRTPDAGLVSACQGDPAIFRALFLSHCSRDKGLFEAVQGVLLANKATEGSPLKMHLTVAGTFLRSADKAEFDRILAQPGAASQVSYVGFVSGDGKQQLLDDADVFCFPSYLESFGLVLAEAMACGLPIVATRCGALPEIVLPNYPCMVDVGNSRQVAEALQRSILLDVFEAHRQRYEQMFTIDRYVTGLAGAIRAVESADAMAFQDWEHPPAHLIPARAGARS
jgi:glycosyltransferase involved in cell wall biosynthesis